MTEGQQLREAIDTILGDGLDQVMGRAFRASASHAVQTEDESDQFVGPYKLLEKIGEGGFGMVYLAEQHEPIRRRVALKIIKLGMDTKEVVARFEAERQALAMMNHENIASVFDAGATDKGRPYFVMELVRGVPITEYCDANRLSTDARLRLFVSICNAVQHAHQKGIIHRDLKPTNVMVTLREGTPVPKVIDFGIAKATQSRLTEKTVYTRTGQLIGTPTYMSPEQIETNEADVDTRSDIYSLGVLLYELLAGTTPIEHDKLVHASYSEMQRLICECEPPKPSTRLGQSGEALAGISSHRNIEPRKLAQQLRGELDWIVMKALEKNRSRRYETANALAIDVTRYLRNEPVEAKGRTVGYLIRKSLLRHKLAAVVVAGFVTLLIAFGATMSVLYQSAREAQRKEAETAEQLRRSLYSYYLSRAATAFENGEFVAMREFLDECPEDLRHWEWARMYARTDDSQKILTGHTDRVWDVCYSADDTRIASVSRDGTLRVWDAGTGESLFNVMAHEGGARDVAFGARDSLIASCGVDGTVRLTDAQTGRPRRILIPVNAGEVLAVAFSRDGQHVAAGGRDNIITIWETADGSTIETLEGHTAPITGLAYSPDDQWIASCSQDRTLRLWNVQTGELVWTSDPVPNWLHSVAFSPNSELVGSGCFNGECIVWNVTSGDRIMSLWGHTGPVHSVAFSPDGNSILSTSLDSTMRLWQVSTGREIATLSGHATGVWSAVFSPKRSQIASAGLDGVRLWDPTSEKDAPTLAGHTDEVRSVAFRSDGGQIASAGFDHSIKLWDPATGKVIDTLKGHTNRVTAVRYSRDGGYILSASDDHTVRRWTSDGKHVQTLDSHVAQVWALAVSLDGRHFASASKDGMLYVWDVETGSEVSAFRAHDLAIEAIEFTPDGEAILTCCRDKTLALWNCKSGERIGAFEGHHDDVLTAGFSPDGKMLASGSADHSIDLWDVESGELLGTLHGHAGQVRRVVFSDDGRRIYSSGADRTIRVWNPESRELLLTLRGHEDTVYDLCVSPDGETIASASADHTIKLWFASLRPAGR